jgi:hypothetical protein
MRHIGSARIGVTSGVIMTDPLLPPLPPAPEPHAAEAEVHLERLGAHPGRLTVLAALLGAGGGPVYRFVATAMGVPHTTDDHVAVGAPFPLLPFQDLDEPTDDQWVTLARTRLDELDAALVREGWRRRPDLGRHWWSRRFER